MLNESARDKQAGRVDGSGPNFDEVGDAFRRDRLVEKGIQVMADGQKASGNDVEAILGAKTGGYLLLGKVRFLAHPLFSPSLSLVKCITFFLAASAHEPGYVLLKGFAHHIELTYPGLCFLTQFAVGPHIQGLDRLEELPELFPVRDHLDVLHDLVAV